MKEVNVRHTTLLALLVAAGLIVFILESLLPPIVPVPGVKPGLANVVVLFTLYAFSKRDAVVVLMLRVLLASVFAGQIVGFWYSAAGGAFSIAAMCIAKRFFDEKNLHFTSITGGVFHNIGQLFAAAVITENIYIFIVYAPVLIFAGMVCGLFTGLICRIIFGRLKKLNLI